MAAVPPCWPLFLQWPMHWGRLILVYANDMSRWGRMAASTDYVDASIMLRQDRRCALTACLERQARIACLHITGEFVPNRPADEAANGAEIHHSASFAHASEATVMPPQSASDTGETPGYEAANCVLLSHASRLVNATCRAQSARREC